MDENNLSRRFCFEHIDGYDLYPCRVRNLDTGAVLFRVGQKTSKKPHGLEVEEDEMERLVLDHNYVVRMWNSELGQWNDYIKTGRSVVGVRRLK